MNFFLVCHSFVFGGIFLFAALVGVIPLISLWWFSGSMQVHLLQHVLHKSLPHFSALSTFSVAFLFFLHFIVGNIFGQWTTVFSFGVFFVHSLPELRVTEHLSHESPSHAWATWTTTTAWASRGPRASSVPSSRSAVTSRALAFHFTAMTRAAATVWDGWSSHGHEGWRWWWDHGRWLLATSAWASHHHHEHHRVHSSAPRSIYSTPSSPSSLCLLAVSHGLIFTTRAALFIARWRHHSSGVLWFWITAVGATGFGGHSKRVYLWFSHLHLKLCCIWCNVISLLFSILLLVALCSSVVLLLRSLGAFKVASIVVLRSVRTQPRYLNVVWHDESYSCDASHDGVWTF